MIKVQNIMITEERKEELRSMTVRDKALLVCHSFLDKDMTREPRTITEEEKKYIEKSIFEYDIPKYQEYIRVYYGYVRIITRFAGYSGEFNAQANQLIGIIRLWKEYQKDEDLFNSVYGDLKHDEALRSKFLKQITSLKFEDAVLKVDDDGIRIDIEGEGGLYGKIKECIKELVFAISLEKSFVLSVEEYAKKTRSKSFMPGGFVKEIKYLKTDLSTEVGKEYSLKELHKREKKGERITEEQRHKAVIPYYEDVDADEDFLQYWKRQIKILANG